MLPDPVMVQFLPVWPLPKDVPWTSMSVNEPVAPEYAPAPALMGAETGAEDLST